MREHGLAGARFTLDQQRPAQRDRSIDRNLQIVGCDIIICAFKTLLIAHEFPFKTQY